MKSTSRCLLIVATVCTTAAVSQSFAGDHGRHHNNQAGMNVRGNDDMMMRADKLDNPDFFKKSDSFTARDAGSAKSKNTSSVPNINFVNDNLVMRVPTTTTGPKTNSGHIKGHAGEVPKALPNHQPSPTSSSPVTGALLPGLETMPIRNNAGPFTIKPVPVTTGAVTATGGTVTSPSNILVPSFEGGPTVEVARVNPPALETVKAAALPSLPAGN